MPRKNSTGTVKKAKKKQVSAFTLADDAIIRVRVSRGITRTLNYNANRLDLSLETDCKYKDYEQVKSLLDSHIQHELDKFDAVDTLEVVDETPVLSLPRTVPIETNAEESITLPPELESLAAKLDTVLEDINAATPPVIEEEIPDVF